MEMEVGYGRGGGRGCDDLLGASFAGARVFSVMTEMPPGLFLIIYV